MRKVQTGQILHCSLASLNITCTCNIQSVHQNISSKEFAMSDDHF